VADRATIDPGTVATARDERRPEQFDVLIVGAGLSGIGAAYHLQTECPGKSFVILEARSASGGTWDLFRYPGVRSDSDMFTLGYRFRPWRGAKAIAEGPSILRYIRETATEHGIDRRIRFGHRVIRACWSSQDARWMVEATDANGETVRFACNFLYMCSGYYDYSEGYMPGWPCMERFRGQIVHPQKWPENLQYHGKRIVVIGSGATAVTLVPALADSAAHVTMLQRSPTYIVARPSQDVIANFLRKFLPARVAYAIVRWKNVLIGMYFYGLARRRPDYMRQGILNLVRKELGPKYDVEKHFSPRYNPWDQRLCVVPNGDLFKAIKAGTASVVTDRVKTFTETGLLLESGTELDADIVITATGLELLFLGGIEMSVDGELVDLPSKLTYKGMMLEGVPNLALAVGYTNASWTLKCDLTCDYVTRLLNHMRATGQTACTPVNHDPSVTAQPLLGLTSGYVQRSADRFPKQGSKFPWQVHQSYLRDYRALKLRGLDDDAMVFSGSPSPRSMVSAS